MKKRFYFFSLFISLISFVQAYGQEAKITYETVSAKEVQSFFKYKSFERFDPGYHKTFIRIANLPQTEKIRLTWRRSLFEGEVHEDELVVKGLLENGYAIDERIPIFVFSSKGFLPGEKITVTISALDESFESNSLEFIPQPIVIENAKGDVKVSAELTSITHYLLTLEGFTPGEKLLFHSVSFGEEAKVDLTYSKNLQLIVCPFVYGQEGDMTEVVITRLQGETIKLTLPWGKATQPHLVGQCLPLVLSFKSLKNQSFAKGSNKIVLPIQSGIPENIDLGKDLPEVKTYSKRLFDPFSSMKVDHEIIDRFIVLKKGVPPEKPTLKLSKKFLFIDGNNPRHFEWAKTHDSKEYTVVVVRGDDILRIRDYMKDKQGLLAICPMETGDMYFDIYGALFQKVGVEKLPSRVTEKGDQIQIEEVPLKLKRLPYNPHL